MSNLPLILAASVPATVEWSPKVAIVMIACNILAMAVGKYGIQQPNEGPATPRPEFFGGLSLPSVAAVWCFGHIMGIGSILGLANLGIL